jgi:putative transcriptional regulator
MPANDNRVRVQLDGLLAERGMTLTTLADKVGLTLANLSILKNGRARAIRFTTLTALCDALRCQPGDLLHIDADQDHADADQDRADADQERAAAA